jgi:uncharacterized phosphatase
VIGLLRHGQTDWNIDFRLQGITDIPLNDTGISQAITAGKVLDANDWDVLLTSPLSRAHDTAQIVAREAGFERFIVEPMLLERSFGEAEGMLHSEWREKYGEGKLVPGGETLEQLALRSWALLDRLATEYRGKRVLTVSHGALIRKLINLVSKGELPREGDRFSNASLSTLVFDEYGWSIAKYDPASLQLKP